MKIATPISHLFLNKQNAQKIIEKSDCLEVRERNLNLNFNKEYLIHIDGDIHFNWNIKYKNYLLSIFKKKIDSKLFHFKSQDVVQAT